MATVGQRRLERCLQLGSRLIERATRGRAAYGVPALDLAIRCREGERARRVGGARHEPPLQPMLSCSCPAHIRERLQPVLRAQAKLNKPKSHTQAIVLCQLVPYAVDGRSDAAPFCSHPAEPCRGSRVRSPNP